MPLPLALTIRTPIQMLLARWSFQLCFLFRFLHLCQKQSCLTRRQGTSSIPPAKRFEIWMGVEHMLSENIRPLLLGNPCSSTRYGKPKLLQLLFLPNHLCSLYFLQAKVSCSGGLLGCLQLRLLQKATIKKGGQSGMWGIAWPLMEFALSNMVGLHTPPSQYTTCTEGMGSMNLCLNAFRSQTIPLSNILMAGLSIRAQILISGHPLSLPM